MSTSSTPAAAVPRWRRPAWRLAAAAVVVAAVAAGITALARPDQAAPSGAWPPNVEVVPAAKRGRLPAWRGEDVRPGKPAIDLAALDGKPLVLNFWASWCGPCRAEQRGLEQASQALAPAGVRFLGVNVRDDRAAASTYLAEFGVAYPSLYDQPGAFVQALGADAPTAPPTTLVVDGSGRIAARVVGTLPGAGGDPAAQAAELVKLVTATTGASAG